MHFKTRAHAQLTPLATNVANACYITMQLKYEWARWRQSVTELSSTGSAATQNSDGKLVFTSLARQCAFGLFARTATPFCCCNCEATIS